MDNVYLKFPELNDKKAWLNYVKEKKDNPTATPGGFKENTKYEEWLDK